MPVEQRERAIRVVINQVNWQQEEPTGYGGGRQLSLNGTSRISREAYVRSCERLGGQFPGLLGGGGAILPPIPIFCVRFSPPVWRAGKPSSGGFAPLLRTIACVRTPEEFPWSSTVLEKNLDAA